MTVLGWSKFHVVIVTEKMMLYPLTEWIESGRCVDHKVVSGVEQRFRCDGHVFWESR